jgi:hypothetical protein
MLVTSSGTKVERQPNDFSLTQLAISSAATISADKYEYTTQPIKHNRKPRSKREGCASVAIKNHMATNLFNKR